MGWTQATIEVIGRLDNHNDERTERDARLWEELTAEIRKLAEQEKYQPLALELFGGAP